MLLKSKFCILDNHHLIEFLLRSCSTHSIYAALETIRQCDFEKIVAKSNCYDEYCSFVNPRGNAVMRETRNNGHKGLV